MWAISVSGLTIPEYNTADLVDTRFVERAAQQANLQANGKPIDHFLLIFGLILTFRCGMYTAFTALPGGFAVKIPSAELAIRN